MSEIITRLEAIVGPKRLQRNEPLSTHTLKQNAGVAELYLEVERLDELIKVIQIAHELDVPVFILGSGSFIEIPDETLIGIVIKNNCRKFDKIGMKGTIRDQEVGVKEVLVHAESGTLMNQLVRFTIEEGLQGLEYQLGLPGTVGGALYTNAKYKKERVRDVVQAIRVLNAEGNIEMHTQDLEKHLAEGILLSVIFRLIPASKKILWERGQEAGEYRRLRV